MIEEFESVALLIDLPKVGLIRGDVGTVVMIHGEQKGFEVEFVNASSRTVAVETLCPKQIKRIDQATAILHVSEVYL